jgi:serine/threonine protein kinase
MNDETVTFTSVEEDQIQNISLHAVKIEVEEERRNYIETECGDDERKKTAVFECVAVLLKNRKLNSSLKKGEKIGNYEIISLVGAGGFATVYKAKHDLVRSLAAIKIFDRTDDDESLKKLIFIKEFKSLYKLNHDGIVKFYDAGIYEKNGRSLPYIIEEFVQGEPLFEYFEKKSPNIRKKLRIFIELCQVIEHIHQEKILHLDLSTKNILITGDPPRIKLIDFGSSKLYRKKTRLTESDFIKMATRSSAAPEQLTQNDKLDPRSDIYSLGSILYRILTDAPPAEKFSEIITPSVRVLNSREKKGHSLLKHSFIFKGDLDAIVLKSLAKEKEDRYQTVAEFRHDVENFLDEKPVIATNTGLRYKLIRAMARFFRIKRDRFGWSKWKTPLVRFSSLLALTALFAYFLFVFLLSPPKIEVPKSIIKSVEGHTLPIRVKNKEGKTIECEKAGCAELRSYFYISCQTGIDDNCFTFLEIPDSKDGFQMGKRASERFTSAYESVNPTELARQENSALPLHPVHLKKFYMSRFEISNRQWNIVIKIPKISLELKEATDSSSLPRTNISYADAVEFCDRLSKDLTRQTGFNIKVRLPSEAEWEYACRAGNESAFGGGDAFSEEFINSIEIPPNTPVWAQSLIKKIRTNPLPDSQFVSNAYGLSAMNGNVWEMVSDSWHDSYNGAPDDGASWDAIDIGRDNKERAYVLRGGAFGRLAYMAQCSYRTQGRFISSGNDQTGFRVVIEAEGID